MPIRAQSADGQIHEFPDGTNPEVVDRVMKNYAESKKPPSTLADMVKSFGAGIPKGTIGAVGTVLGDIPTALNRSIDYLEDAIAPGPTLSTLITGKKPHPEYANTLGSESLQRGVEKVTGKFYEPKTEVGRLAGSAGEFVGNPFSWIGPENLAIKTLSAVGGGIGSEMLGQVGDVISPGVGTAGRIIGGGIGGSIPGSIEKARVNARETSKLKDEAQIKAKADQGYSWIRDPTNTVNVTPAGIDNLWTMVRTDLEKADADPISSPQTYAKLGVLSGGKGIHAGGLMAAPATSSDLLSLHNRLGQITDPADARAARVARDTIRDWMGRNMPPKAKQKLEKAMGDWAHYQMITDVRQSLTDAIQRAEVSGTNKNAINTMRQEIRKILRNDKRVSGFPKAAKEGMETIISGGMLENFLRWAGKQVPYGSSFALVTGTAAVVSAMQNAVLAGVFGTLAVGAFGARKLGDFLTRKQIEGLVTILQQQAPSNKWQVKQSRRVTRPLENYPAIGAARGAAVGASTPEEVLANPSGIPLQ